MALTSYSTGTVSIASGATTAVGVSTLWAVNVLPGDLLVSGTAQATITDVTDDIHLAITPWPGGALAGATYKIWQMPGPRNTTQASKDVSKLVAYLNTTGIYLAVDASLSAPDPSVGDENQFAFQASTKKLWLKTGGMWVYQGIYKGLNITGAYDNAHTYSVGDVVSSAGSSYVWSNVASGSGHAPPDTTYWQIVASKGDPGTPGTAGTPGTPGAAGANAPTYGGTSTTSLAIGTGAKAFTTQAGLAYQSGARVRATAASDTTKWMEGVATYAGTALTITVDKTGGTGTFASWVFNVTGQPGAGDLLGANNLADVSDPTAARNNLGAGTVSSVATSGLATGGPITGSGTVAVTAATAADQSAGSSNAKAVTPAVQQNHKSAIKAWANFVGSTGAILASYNASVVRNGVGDYTINFATGMVDTNYVVTGSANANSAANAQAVINLYATSAAAAGIVKTTAGVRILVANASTGGPADFGQVSVMIIGN